MQKGRLLAVYRPTSLRNGAAVERGGIKNALLEGRRHRSNYALGGYDYAGAPTVD